MGEPVDEWKKNQLEELHEAEFIQDVEGWTESLTVLYQTGWSACLSMKAERVPGDKKVCPVKFNTIYGQTLFSCNSIGY